MNPWESLADYWDGLVEANIYPTLTDQLDTPCVVILPDEPWIEAGASGSNFQTDQERYRAIAVVKSSDPQSAQSKLHALAHFIREHLPDGWDFESASGPQQTDHQGITYTAVDSRLTFRDCSETGETP